MAQQGWSPRLCPAPGSLLPWELPESEAFAPKWVLGRDKGVLPAGKPLVVPERSRVHKGSGLCDCGYTGRGPGAPGGGAPTEKPQRPGKCPHSLEGGWTAGVRPKPLQAGGREREGVSPLPRTAPAGEKGSSRPPPGHGPPSIPTGGRWGPAGLPPRCHRAKKQLRTWRCRPSTSHHLRVFPFCLSVSCLISVLCHVDTGRHLLTWWRCSLRGWGWLEGEGDLCGRLRDALRHSAPLFTAATSQHDLG